MAATKNGRNYNHVQVREYIDRFLDLDKVLIIERNRSLTARNVAYSMFANLKGYMKDDGMIKSGKEMYYIIESFFLAVKEAMLNGKSMVLIVTPFIFDFSDKMLERKLKIFSDDKIRDKYMNTVKKKVGLKKLIQKQIEWDKVRTALENLKNNINK